MTSCILAEDESKVESEQSISPLKEPLKKKGNDITNPYPNFKVCATHVKLVINMILYRKNAQKATFKCRIFVTSSKNMSRFRDLSSQKCITIGGIYSFGPIIVHQK